MNTQQSTPTLDRQALIKAYHDHSPGIYRYAYRSLGDINLAEDCVAETFSRFLGMVQRDHLLQSNPQSYLYRIAHNWIVDQYRHQPVHVELDENIAPYPEGDLEMEVSHRQNLDQLRNALHQLPEEQRLVIEMRFMEDWSHDQVAKTLGKTVDATRALQYRALESLRLLFHRQKEIEI